jgi:hypothetical protein
VIDQVDQLLKEWVAEVIPEVEIQFGPPRGSKDSKGSVDLYLVELLPLAPASDSRRLSPQILLGYLITTWADTPEGAHRMLGNLVFAAMEDSRFEVELVPLTAQTWNAFNVEPQPSFMLRHPLRLERAERDVSLIRKPIDVRKVSLAGLDGIVIGHENIPIANVRVELRDHQMATRTDSKGRFRFGSVPTQPLVKQFCIEGRGRKMIVEVEHGADEKKPLIIHFDATEV